RRLFQQASPTLKICASQLATRMVTTASTTNEDRMETNYPKSVRRRRLFLLNVTFIFRFTFPTFPQALTNAITKKLQDPTMTLIPNVDVSIANPTMIKKARNAVSDEQGIYQFTLLPTNAYHITFTLPSFKTLKIDE